MRNSPESPLSSLDPYLGQIDRYKLMSAAQELRLARRYRRTHDPRAARILVVRNLRFVVKVAAQLRFYGISINDLVQEGNIGLMHAVEKFDPEKGNRLITYAVWWIRAYMQEHILRSWSLVRLGTTQAQRKLFFSLARTKRELSRFERNGEPPTTEHLAENLGVKPAEVTAMEQRLDSRDLSLDAPRRREDGAPHLTLLPSLAPLADQLLEEAGERQRLMRLLDRALKRLDPRERYIIERRFFSDPPLRFHELGDQFGFSSERARQLETRAKGKLRSHLERLATGT